MKVHTDSVYQKLLDPETLLDYNPVDGGVRIGVAGLAGVTLGDTCIYTIKAHIGTENSLFIWNSRPNWKSKDGTYIFENINQDFEIKRYKADEKTFVLYTISKYDYKTKEKVINYAFGM